LTFGVFILAALVRRTVYLNDKVSFSAVEIDDEPINRMLTAKPESQKTAVSQTVPE
jgi:hypothetical protein